jgi:hypothetical protein
MACESTRLGRDDKSPSELDKLLQHGVVGEHEYNDVAGFHGIELIRIGIGRNWWTLSLYESRESVHVSPPDR